MPRQALDTTRPNVARTYDAPARRADNYADPDQADELTRIYPGLRDMVGARGGIVQPLALAMSLTS